MSPPQPGKPGLGVALWSHARGLFRARKGREASSAGGPGSSPFVPSASGVMLLAVLLIPHPTPSLTFSVALEPGSCPPRSVLLTSGRRNTELKMTFQQPLHRVIKGSFRDFPGGPGVKNRPCNAGDTCSIPGQGTKIPQPTRHS